ncbi:MAG: winged helix-turn-helix transcriptional regulator [Bacteroidales bacterium]|nr:winged helix-turn-helix transcriptional regulator [Bacteroidales bacterium]
MQNIHKVFIAFLNFLFCFVLLWLFTRNALLRPYAGSAGKEILAGLLLLATLYANYFLLYPKLYHKYSHALYWTALLIITLAAAWGDMSIAYANIAKCNAELLQVIGKFKYLSWCFVFIFARNFAFNLFPFLLRERLYVQQLLDKEVHAVYHETQKIDVVDKNGAVRLIAVADIYSCSQEGNYTYIRTTQNETHTRLGSMKHLEQLLGNGFVRITPKLLLPIRYIHSCRNGIVVMKKMPFEEESQLLAINPKNKEEIASEITQNLLRRNEEENKASVELTVRKGDKRKSVVPPKEKLRKIQSCIHQHPGIKSADIAAKTGYSTATVERSLAALKQRGLITHTGSKKTGGYYAVEKEG